MTINSEEEAIEALAAVTAWAKEAPDAEHSGEYTHTTFRRGRVLASVSKDDGTFGLSTYTTVEGAQSQLEDMEREYRNWLMMARFQPSVVVGRMLNSPESPQEG